MQIAEERLKPIGVKVIFNAGNDDLPAVRDILADSEYVVYPEERIVLIDDKHEMPSVGYSNMTPWNCPGDLSEEELLSKIEKIDVKSDRPQEQPLQLPLSTTRYSNRLGTET